MHDYARHLVASTAAQVLPARGSSVKTAIARQFLPYCVSPVGDRFILLNREYKPLGWPTRRKGRVDYGDPMFASMLVWLDHTDVACLPSATTDAGVFFYLYGLDDRPPPWRDVDSACAYVRSICALLGSRHVSREGAA